MCNKISYQTKQQAITERNFFSRDGRNNLCRMTPYLCDDCGEWHLTSESKQVSRRFKRWDRKNKKRRAKIQKLISEFRKLKTDGDKWKFIADNQCELITVEVYDDKACVIFGKKTRFVFDKKPSVS